jgi:hypothetical protein
MTLSLPLLDGLFSFGSEEIREESFSHNDIGIIVDGR